MFIDPNFFWPLGNSAVQILNPTLALDFNCNILLLLIIIIIFITTIIIIISIIIIIIIF